MDRSDILAKVTRDIEGCRIFRSVGIQKVNDDMIIRNRKSCEENLCGNYGKSWTCPPNCGSPQSCIDRMRHFNDMDLLIVSYDNVDVKDEKAMSVLADTFRNVCRNAMIEYKKNGIDAMALFGGPCSYCKRCAILDGKDCYHPDMQVPSVSGYGIDMKPILSKVGESFSFSDDKVTLYGLILFRSE